MTTGNVVTRRDRLSALIANLTGAEGPLRVVLDFLRGMGFGERVLKTAIAVAVAWELARLLPDNPNPVLAAMTAMFSIQLTIAGSVSDAVQRVFGVVWGVSVAVIVNWAFGLHAWTLGIVVLIAFAGGRKLRLKASGISQMAVSALLVILGAAGTQVNNVAWLHFANTIVGTTVGILLNAAIAPPNYLPTARKALQELARRIELVIDDLANGLAIGMTRERADSCLDRARFIAVTLDEVESSITQAEESLKFHLLAKHQRLSLAVFHRADRALEHTAIQTRVMCRTVVDILETAPAGESRPDWIEPEILGIQMANMLSAVAVALGHFRTLIDSPRSSMSDEALMEDVQTARNEVISAARFQLVELMPDGWTLLGEVIAISGQLVADLSNAANDLEKIAIRK